jgi:hypothetical protein
MSLVEWCERQSNPYELTNSISNAAFVIAYAVSPDRVGALRRCDQLIAVVGIGSFYFHITGSYVGELMDELPMSLLAYFYFVVVYESPRYNRAYALTTAFVWFLYIQFELYSIFVIFFASQLILPVCIVATSRRRPQLTRTALCLVFAVSCWGYERHLHANGQCPTSISDPNYYLHSYWHIGTALAHYYFMESI